jgi:hypothetical protein
VIRNAPGKFASVTAEYVSSAADGVRCADLPDETGFGALTGIGGFEELSTICDGGTDDTVPGACGFVSPVPDWAN